MAAGLVFATAAAVISLGTFLWFMPIMLGLVLSPAVSWLTSMPNAGRWLWQNNVFCIPEEQQAADLQAVDEPLETVLQAAE